MTEWHPVSGDTARRLTDAGLDVGTVTDLIRGALDEDLDGGEDVTSTATVPASQRSVLDLVARKSGVVAGAPVAAAVFDMVGGDDGSVTIASADGTDVQPGDVVVSATGSTRDLLTAERTALNLLCHLSGVATVTQQWVAALDGTGAKVRDTRKTTPGMRRLEKYAVRCGGGVNHRMSLSDAALVKDNHVLAAGGVVEAFDAVRAQYPGLPIEVEVDSLEQLAEVLDAGADLVLLDNFTPDQMRSAVAINAGRSVLEASGGLTLDMAADVGATGVDYLAVGALTHSAPALDIGADLRS
jgi:nicotinate-nucleotide pyrophosphorylase (carboxylating)